MSEANVDARCPKRSEDQAIELSNLARPRCPRRLTKSVYPDVGLDINQTGVEGDYDHLLEPSREPVDPGRREAERGVRDIGAKVEEEHIHGKTPWLGDWLEMLMMSPRWRDLTIRVVDRVTVLTGIFPPDIGGPATSVPDLVEQLKREGREVAIVTLADGGDEADTVACPTIRIPRSMTRLRRAREVVGAVRHTKPDVVLANGLHIESALVSGIPIVQKIVGDWAWERARNKGWTTVDVNEFQEIALVPLPVKARSLRFLRTAVTRRARLVIVPSKYVARLVRAWGIDETRIRVVSNAAPPVSRLNESRSLRGLFVGRLVNWKHVDHLIHVLARIAGLHLEIVGTGPEFESLQRLSDSLGVADRVVFHGSMPRERVMEKMRDASFLAVPSSYEGMPHVVLEAFAAGLPVVASDAAGTPELVEHNVSGLLYPCGNLEAFQEAVRTILVPKVANRLAQGGVSVARRLTTEASAAATSAVLDEALGR